MTGCRAIRRRSRRRIGSTSPVTAARSCTPIRPMRRGRTPPTTARLAFFGLSNYNANPAAYNSTVFINTPITSDAAGDIFFGFIVTGSNPAGIDQRRRANRCQRHRKLGPGGFRHVAGGDQFRACAEQRRQHALRPREHRRTSGSGKLVALNSHTLAVTAQVSLKDPHTGN